MSVYLITWNLNREKQNYSAIRAALMTKIESYKDNKRDSGLESVHFISTQDTATQVYNNLVTGILDTNDRIIIVKLTRGLYRGWADQDLANWIETRV